MLSGKGIPQCVLCTIFATVIKAGPSGDLDMEASVVLSTLEHLELLQRAGHSVSQALSRQTDIDMSQSSLGENDDPENDDWDEFDELPKRPAQQYYTMHDSLRAMAELMSQRMLPCFTPEDDQQRTIAFRHASRKRTRLDQTPKSGLRHFDFWLRNYRRLQRFSHFRLGRPQTSCSFANWWRGWQGPHQVLCGGCHEGEPGVHEGNGR